MSGEQDGAGARIDASVPHSARIWNYWMGGNDNFPVDREAGDAYAATFPGIVDMARQSRAFLIRVVRTLAGEYGVRQFLDIGAGLPTHDNTHQVAQKIAREARIVYVDDDPLVLAHARVLLTSAPEGATAYIDGDIRDPDAILRQAARTLDFQRPVALMLMGVLGHIDDDGQASAIVRRLVDALPSGGFLVERDGVDVGAAITEAQRGYNDTGAVPYRLRTHDQIAGFFTGLTVLEPGIVSCSRWRPDIGEAGEIPEVAIHGGVGRKDR